MNYSMFKTKKLATDKDNLVEALLLMSRNFEELGKEYETFNVTKIGRLVEVEAYYHEVDEYYKCVGFEVEIESRFAFGEGANKTFTELETQVGFFSIWMGKAHPAAPMTFEEGNGSLGECYRYDNGYGDRANLIKEIYSEEEVQKIAQKLANLHIEKNSSAS